MVYTWYFSCQLGGGLCHRHPPFRGTSIPTIEDGDLAAAFYPRRDLSLLPRQDPRIDFDFDIFVAPPFSLMNHPIVFAVGEMYCIYDNVN